MKDPGWQWTWKSGGPAGEIMSTVFESRTLTAEEYLRVPDDGRLTELVRGEIVEMNRLFTSHGYFCVRITFVLFQFVDERGLGRVVSNDAGVVTQRIQIPFAGRTLHFKVISECHVARCPRDIGLLHRNWPSKSARRTIVGGTCCTKLQSIWTRMY